MAASEEDINLEKILADVAVEIEQFQDCINSNNMDIMNGFQLFEKLNIEDGLLDRVVNRSKKEIRSVFNTDDD